MIFYLGTHHPSWLWRVNIPLFVSRRRLTDLKTLNRATCRWALDSGGFSELSLYGKWTISPEQYVREVDIYQSRIGPADFIATQDWMCEPPILKKTGLTVLQHQERTVTSFLTLRDMRPEIKWLPVLQGWVKEDYLRCIEMYSKSGVDLKNEPVVGLGSVCRRQSTKEIADLVKELASLGLKLHGFGVKTLGLKQIKNYLYSSDSLAWSFQARRSQILLPECDLQIRQGLIRGHKNCANCIRYALKWRESVMDIVNAN